MCIQDCLPGYAGVRVNRLAPQQRPAFVTTMHGHYSVSRYSSVMARGSKTIAVSEHIRSYTLKNYPAVKCGRRGHHSWRRQQGTCSPTAIIIRRGGVNWQKGSFQN